MPVPVWVVPAAKTAGKWMLSTLVPPAVEFTKKHLVTGYQAHGLNPKLIAKHLITQALPATQKTVSGQGAAKQPAKRKPRTSPKSTG